MGAPLRIVIVEDHRLVADGLEALLGAEPDLTVVGIASDVADALALIERASPDVVICDVQLDDKSGFSVLEEVGQDGPAFVMYSSHDHPRYARSALDGGALGFVLKGAPSHELVAAVRAAGSGRTSYSAEALRGARSGPRMPTGRQLEIIEALAAGRSNDEISTRLGIAPKTIESHLRTLFECYDVANRTELVLRAVSEGWIRARGSAYRGWAFHGGPEDWFAEPAVVPDRGGGAPKPAGRSRAR